MNYKTITLVAFVMLPGHAPAYAKNSATAPAWLAKAKADCTERVVSEYGVDAGRIKLGKNRDDAKGLLNITGTVDKGTEGVKSFMCKFNSDGALVDVMSMTSDGAL